MKLLKCIIKNFKILIRSRVASFVILLAPLFIFLLLELAFDAPEQYSLNIGVYSSVYTNTSEEIINHLEQSYFTISKTVSKDECIANIKGGIFNTCVFFPENMTVGQADDFVEIIVDTSKNNMVFVIKDIIKNSIDAHALEVSEELTEKMIDNINFIERTAKDRLFDTTSSRQLLMDTSSLMDDASSSINSMDLNYDGSNLNLKSEKSKVKLALTQSKNSLLKTVAMKFSIMNKFDEIKDRIWALSLEETERDDFLGYVNATEIHFENLAEDYEYYGNISNKSLSEVYSKFQNLSNELDLVEEKLAKTEILKVGAAETLQNSSEKINETLTLINTIKNSLTEINNKLAGIVIREAEEIVKPFDYKLISITPSKSQVSLLFPQFLGVVILFISLIIPTIMAVNERRSIAAVRQALTPVYRVVYISSVFLTNLIIVLTQVFLVMVLSYFLLDLTITNNLISFFISVFLSSSAFIMIGIFIGQLFDEEHNAIIATVSLASLLLFISGVILPLETMPPAFYKLNLYNPFVVTIALLRKSLFFQIPILENSKEFIILLSYWFLFYLLTFLHIFIFQKHKIFDRLYHRFKK